MHFRSNPSDHTQVATIIKKFVTGEIQIVVVIKTEILIEIGQT